MAAQAVTQDRVVNVNRLQLVGRLGDPPVESELPSGDVIASFRVIVDRPAGHGSGQRVDTLDCTAWTARVRRSVRGWQKGDLVEIEGALRRRFFATPAGRASRFDVEVSSARRVRRAASA